MKIVFTSIAILLFSSISFGQSNVEIVSAIDGINYASDTATIVGADFYDVGGSFYVINTDITTAEYNYGVIPKSVSNPTFGFQLCSAPPFGLCYNVDVGIGILWMVPEGNVSVAAGDTTEIEIKMAVNNQSGTGIANYYVMAPNTSGSGYHKLDSITVVFTSTVSVNTQTEKPTFKIYPNPAKEGVTIQGEGLKNGGTVLFLDALGQEVKRVNLSEMHTMINVSSLNKGVYFVSIFDENGTKSKTQRLIIQ